MKKFSLVLLCLVLSLSLILSGCGNSGATSTSNNVEESKEFKFAISSEPPNLDPQIGTDQYSITIDNAILEGLVRVYDGKVMPGMAEKWDISEDGKTYTFHLRDAVWNDGKAVSAKDFEYSFKRLLNPVTASEYAFQGYYIKNGQAYNEGKITDESQVGVKAIDDKTLEVTLEVPCKYFLGLLSFISFQPSRRDIVEANSDSYASEPSKMVYNGPFILNEWRHEEVVLLEKNPNYWNKDAIKLDNVAINIISDGKTQLNMYETGDIDIVNIPKDFLAQYQEQGKALYFGDGSIAYLQFNTKAEGKEKFLGNANIRKAIAYAIDRQSYVDAVLKNGSQAAMRYVLPLLAGNEKKFAEEYPMELEYGKNGSKDLALSFLEKGLSEIGMTKDNMPAVRFLTDDNESSRLSAEALQDMFAKSIGLKLDITQVPFKQRLELMKSKDYDIVFALWGPDYDDPMTYLDLWTTTSGHNNTGWSNAAFDQAIEFCKTTSDMKARADKMFEAEKILMDEMPIVPVYFRQRAWAKSDAVQGLVRGFIGTDTDFIFADINK